MYAREIEPRDKSLALPNASTIRHVRIRSDLAGLEPRTPLKKEMLYQLATNQYFFYEILQKVIWLGLEPIISPKRRCSTNCKIINN